MLTAVACQSAVCPEGKARLRLADSGGLYLEIGPTGSKRWFYKYRFAQKEKRIALGVYPGVSLKDARDAHADARKLLKGGTDPALQRKLDKLAAATSNATTFEAVAREFHASKVEGWSENHASQWLRCLEKDIFPWLGALPLTEISAPLLLAALRRVEQRGVRVLPHDLLEYAGQVFRYGIATGRCERDITPDLRGALKTGTVKHMAALTDPRQVGDLLRSIDAYSGQPTTRAALALSALTFQRPGNIRAMEWAWINADTSLLTIPAAKMKRRKKGKLNGRPHLVPLACQAKAVLADLRPLTGHGRFVFPSLLSGEACMSENTVRAALRRLGYSNDEMTAHGFRAMARTVIAEQISGIDHEVVEAQLGHAKAGSLGEAYDRADHMVLRRQMMQTWADYLDKLRDGAQVIPMPSRTA